MDTNTFSLIIWRKALAQEPEKDKMSLVNQQTNRKRSGTRCIPEIKMYLSPPLLSYLLECNF